MRKMGKPSMTRRRTLYQTPSYEQEIGLFRTGPGKGLQAAGALVIAGRWGFRCQLCAREPGAMVGGSPRINEPVTPAPSKPLEATPPGDTHGGASYLQASYPRITFNR